MSRRTKTGPLRAAECGFTLIELLVVMVVTTVVTVAVLSFAIDFWGSNATLQTDLETYVDRSNAGDKLREALNVSSGLIMQNSLPDDNPMDPDPSDATGQYWDTIHAIPGTTNIGSSGTYTPIIYWQSPATERDKTIIMNGEQPYVNQFVLYLDNGNKELLLRKIANANAPDNATVSSCPPSSATASCPADTLISKNISSIDTRYFSRSGNTIDHTSIVEKDSLGNPVVPTVYIGPDFTTVEVVELTLHLFKKSTIHGAADTINSTTIRVAIRNR